MAIEILLKSMTYATSNSDRFLCARNHFETALIDDGFHDSVSTEEVQNILY